MSIGGFKRFFCSHNWEVMVNSRIDEVWDNKEVPHGYKWVIVQRCKKCGKIQKDVIKV